MTYHERDLFDLMQSFVPSHGNVYYYGYTVTIGPDGRPIVTEYGNKPNIQSNKESTMVDTIVDDKTNTIKLVAEMPGIEKNDIRIAVNEQTVSISAEREGHNYQTSTELPRKVDKESAKATYKNGILEIVFKIIVDDVPTGHVIDVQ